MTKIYNNIEETIGNTPLVELSYFEEKYNISGRLLAKVEFFNPAGSVKDRVAKEMIFSAEQAGIIKKGSVIIEPTSGNTGIGLCALGAKKGYRVIIVMPDTMSVERQMLMRAYGAEVILTDGKLGMSGAIKKAEELSKEIPQSFIPSQFTNPSNPKAHYKTTAVEIWNDTDGDIDVFVAGVGTGGTITGVGQYLKEKRADIKIIGAEPLSSPFLTKGERGAHKIQGIGAGFMPEILDIKILDKIITVSDEDAITTCREIAQKEGILVGISSAASLVAALEYLKERKEENLTTVVLFPDSGERYLSSDVF